MSKKELPINRITSELSESSFFPKKTHSASSETKTTILSSSSETTAPKVEVKVQPSVPAKKFDFIDVDATSLLRIPNTIDSLLNQVRLDLKSKTGKFYTKKAIASIILINGLEDLSKNKTKSGFYKELSDLKSYL